MINVSGTHIVYGLIGEMLSKHEIVATDKKYKFATLRNCSYKPLGRNVTTLYFDVDIELLLNFNGAFVSRSELIENTRDIGFSCSFLNIDVARSRTEGDFVKDLFLFCSFEFDEDDETDGLDSNAFAGSTSVVVCVVLSLAFSASPLLILSIRYQTLKPKRASFTRACVCVYIFPPKCVRFLLTSSRDDDDDPKSRTVFVLHEQKHSAKFLPKILPRYILFVGVVLSQRRQRRQRERLLLLFNQHERKNINFQRILTFFGGQLAIYVKFVRFQMCVEIYNTLSRADEMCLSFYASQRFAYMYIYAYGLL